MLANDATGLDANDVFYFGNAIGSTGHDPDSAAVGSQDRVDVRDNPHSFLNPAEIDNRYDMNCDGRVGAEDRLIVRDHPTSFLSALWLISVPGLEAEQEPSVAPALATPADDPDDADASAEEPITSPITASRDTPQPSPALIAAYFDRVSHHHSNSLLINDDDGDDRNAWWEQHLAGTSEAESAGDLVRII